MPKGTVKKHKRVEGASRRYDSGLKKKENKARRDAIKEKKNEERKRLEEEVKVFQGMKQNSTPGYPFAAIDTTLPRGFVKKALKQQKMKQKMEENKEIANILLQPSPPPSPVRNPEFSELDYMNNALGQPNYFGKNPSPDYPLNNSDYSTPSPLEIELNSIHRNNYNNYIVEGGKRRKSVKRKNKSGRKRTVKKNKAKGKKTRKN